MISFVTNIKICRYYENYADRLEIIENIKLGCDVFDVSRNYCLRRCLRKKHQTYRHFI